MRLLVDDVFFCYTDSGITRYWRSVLSEWAEWAAKEFPDLEILVLNSSGQMDEFGFRTIDFPRRYLDKTLYAADRVLLSRICESHEIDVFISTYYTFPLSTPSVLLVHDLIPEVFGYSDSHRSWLERGLATVASDSFITVSDSTKHDLCQLYPFIDEDEVVVAHCGLDLDQFTRATDKQTQEFKARHKLPDDYLLMMGARFGGDIGYKNGELVYKMQELAGIKKRDLVVTGGEPIQEWELRVARKQGFKIHRLQLSDKDLVTCISGASVLLYPSLYEGFGMPPLEALAVGTPVVTTDVASLPESVGSLSIFVTGEDAGEFARAVDKATSPEWVERIRKDGPNWASNFSWRRSAELILQSIQRLGAKPTDTHERLERLKLLVEYNDAVLPLQS